MIQSPFDQSGLDFLISIDRARSTDGATRLFVDLLERNGFDSFACGDYDAFDIRRSIFMASAWPEGFVDFYYGKTDLAPDPIRRTIPAATMPFTWSDLLTSPATASAMQHSVARSRGFGWTEGLIVPIGPRSYRRTMVSIKGRRPLVQPFERSLLAVACTAFYDRLRLLGAAPEQVDHRLDLTRRELECLACVAHGLNDGEISGRLGIARTTAHEHVENGKRKLGAHNRAHAVAIALTRGLIDAP